MSQRDCRALIATLIGSSLILSSVAFAQSREDPGTQVPRAAHTSLQKDSGSDFVPYVKIISAPAADTMIYEDRWDGFRFEYPSFLHPDDLALSFRNSDDSNVIALHSEFSSADPRSYLELRKHLPSLSISREVINGVSWVSYSPR